LIDLFRRKLSARWAAFGLRRPDEIHPAGGSDGRQADHAFVENRTRPIDIEAGGKPPRKGRRGEGEPLPLVPEDERFGPALIWDSQDIQGRNVFPCC